MKKVKGITAILLALMMCLALVACNGGTTDDAGTTQPGGTTSPGGTTGSGSSASPNAPVVPVQPDAPAPEGEDVRYAEAIDILTVATLVVIDCQAPGATSDVNRCVYSCIYDRLIALTPEGEYVPELATSWDSPDAQTYTFQLRNDVYFSNGDKFTAQDVVDTILLGKESVGSMAFDTWRPVDTVTAIGEYTVQIVLSDVNADFLFNLRMPWASIINKAAREADPVEGAWVGTGAFIVSDFVSAEYTTLTRKDDYWGGLVPTKYMTFRYVPEITARTIMLQNGETQASMNISPEDLPMFYNDPDNFTVFEILSSVTNSIGFNMNGPITGDLNFRMAVAHALIRDEIAEAASGRWAIPAVDGTLWGYTTEFRNTDIPMLPYDLDLARQYLADSPYNGEEIEIITGTPENHRGGEMIQEQLARIGINTRLFPTDAPTVAAHASYGSETMQMIHYLNTFSISATSARQVLYPFGAANRASYNNPVVNDLIDLAPTVVDPAERGAIYKQIQEIVAQDLPYINIFYVTRCITAVSGFGGAILDPDLNHDFRLCYVRLD